MVPLTQKQVALSRNENLLKQNICEVLECHLSLFELRAILEFDAWVS